MKARPEDVADKYLDTFRRIVSVFNSSGIEKAKLIVPELLTFDYYMLDASIEYKVLVDLDYTSNLKRAMAEAEPIVAKSTRDLLHRTLSRVRS